MIPETVRELCERYERNERSYRSDDYNEARLRQEFLNPFFKALGWDMENEQGWAEAYKDVVHEDSIDVAGHRKAPDYSFGIGKDRKFYVEAKKPLISVNDSKDAAFQLRSYAWSSKFSLSILTNFAEFAVYDCRFKPDMKDKPGLHRINYFKHTDYLEQWDLIASVFSRDAILKGSFDKYALEGKGKRGTEPVDEEFLKEIEEWRKVLARNINLRNPNTSLEDLNFAVGKIIDRLLFLRICEDRKIEEYEQIGKLRSGVGAYMKMIGLFKQADDWYNAGLFHFNPQHKRAEGPDLLTPKLIVDDKILKGIIDTLYLPKSPYKFEKFPADILGQVYEQFLGKVIVKKGRTVDPVEKPEVKKAGGVYYTPTYIVEYIVEHTVGKLVDGKTPDEVAKLKVLDPACGSGSFLIGAYQHLLDWHQTYYEKQIKAGEKASKLPVYESVTGKWKLTLPERKRILLNNIYGVDIDAQAVEVTKLSLLLKVLEGENRASVQGEVKQHHAALPDLGNNIKCGNSLVAPDINTVLESSRKRKQTPPTPPAIRGGELREYPVNGGESELTEEEWHKINPFDWQTEFASIFKQGGFDAVIGNPPYIPIESMSKIERAYYSYRYPVLERKYDSSVVFILEGLNKLKENGKLGYISSLTWQTGENYSGLRSILIQNYGIDFLINLPFDTFKAYVDTGVYILCREQNEFYSIYRFAKNREKPDLTDLEYSQIPISSIAPPNYKIVLDPFITSLENRFKDYILFGDLTFSTQGLAGNRFSLSKRKTKKNDWPFLAKGQVHRYETEVSDIAFTSLDGFPSLCKFYEANPKILIRRVISRQNRLLATFAEDKMVYKKDINPFVMADKQYSPFYLLGIINSTLISYLYLNSSTIATKDDFRQTTLAELRNLPIRTIDFKDKQDKARHDKMVRLVKKMLELNKKLPATTTPGAREKLERQIAATDREIDLLVYELYGLTEEERKIVEKDEG